MATGIGNLPYTMPPVSPFDVITSQAENERIANIESLADGTGIGDKAITAPKIDFTTFGYATLNTTSATLSTTSGSFRNVPGGSVSFTKQNASSRVLVNLTVTSTTSNTGIGVKFGVNINSTDYKLSESTRTTTTRLSSSGSMIIPSIPAGTYTVNTRALVGGGVTLTIGSSDHVSLTLVEV